MIARTFPERSPALTSYNGLILSPVTKYEPLVITSRGTPGNESVLQRHHHPFKLLIRVFHAESLQEASFILEFREPRNEEKALRVAGSFRSGLHEEGEIKLDHPLTG